MTQERAKYRGGRVDPQDDGPNERPAGACEAHGCPMPGSVSTGGAWCCSAHAGQEVDRWQAITAALRSSRWLIDFIGQLQGTSMRRGQGWRTFADNFWRADPHGKPSKDETLELYLYRMHLELMHQAGVKTDRPAPLVPQAVAWAKPEPTQNWVEGYIDLPRRVA